MNGRFDWCNLGQCVGCPGLLPEREWPDPARKGKTYTLPERRCSHECHTRPALRKKTP